MVGTFLLRRWVLQSLIQECCPSKACKERSGAVAVTAAQTERLQRILQEEMKACSEAAGRYPSNYNAWSHRIWVIQNLAKDNKKVSFATKFIVTTCYKIVTVLLVTLFPVFTSIAFKQMFVIEFIRYFLVFPV